MNTISTSFPTDFTRIGGRTHVLGFTMVDFMVSCVFEVFHADSNDLLVIERTKFLHKTGCNGTVQIFPDGDNAEFSNDAACTMQCHFSDGRKFASCFSPDEQSVVEKTFPDETFTLSDIGLEEEYSGSAHSHWDDRHGLLASITETSKQLILKTLATRADTPTIEVVQADNIPALLNTSPADGLITVRNIGAFNKGSRLYVLNEVSCEAWPDTIAQYTFSITLQDS